MTVADALQATEGHDVAPREPTSREDAERMVRDCDPLTPDGALQVTAAFDWLTAHGCTPTAARYLHGGAPGLAPGDPLLPFDGASAVMSDGVRRGGVRVAGVRRRDRVYVTTVPVIAWHYAAQHQRGWVYVVEPVGGLEPDPSPGFPPGVAFETPWARVVRGCPVPDDVRDTLRAVTADSATDSGWVECSDGKVRWGRHGAAGVLFRHPPTGRFYLHRRSATVDHPGTWALPGGALLEGETSVEAALREAAEEIGVLPEHEVTGATPCAITPEWTYTIVTADVPERFFADPGVGESDVDGWFTPDKLTQRRLHPDLAEHLPRSLAMEGVTSS